LVPGRQRAAEESNGTICLVENCPDARAGRVALNDEWLGEIWKGQRWSSRQSLLEREECRFCLCRPLERITLEEACQGGRNCPKFFDETPVVPG
jgi:hypothetical protein